MPEQTTQAPPVEATPRMPDVAAADVKGGDGESASTKPLVDALENTRAANEADGDPKAAEDTLKDLADGDLGSDANPTTVESDALPPKDAFPPAEAAQADASADNTTDSSDSPADGQRDPDKFMTDEEWQTYRAGIKGNKSAGPVGRVFSRMGTRLQAGVLKHKQNVATRAADRADKKQASAEDYAKKVNPDGTADTAAETPPPDADADAEAQAPQPAEGNTSPPPTPEGTNPSNEAPAVESADAPVPPTSPETTQPEAANADAGETSEPADTKAETPESGGTENTADTELTPEQKAVVEAKKTIEGVQSLAKLGIDINSPEGQAVLDMMAENPQYAEAYKVAAEAAAANINTAGPEGAAAAAGAMSGTLDNDIAKAESDGRTEDVKRFRFLKGLLLLLGKALLTVGGAAVAYGAGVSASTAAQSLKSPK